MRTLICRATACSISMPKTTSQRLRRQIFLVPAWSALAVLCWLPQDAAARPGRGNCTGCHGPALSTTPPDGSTLDFGTVLVGESSDRALTITNTGGNSGGRSVSLSGNFPASFEEFTLNGQMHFSNLKRTTSVNRTYTYTPGNRGSDSHPMTATADTSSDGYPVINGTSTVTFIGRGVAPLSAVDSSLASAGAVRIGTGGTSRIVVQNVGDGNLSNRGAVSNLKGNAGTGSAAFLGTGGSIDLADLASVTFPYSFTPATHGPQAATVGLTFTNGSPAGTNQAHSVNVELQGVGAGPDYGSSRVPGSLIDFGTVAGGQTGRQVLSVSNLTPDGDLGNLTDLTMLSAIVTGPDSGMFSLGQFTPGSVLSAAAAIDLELLFDPHGQAGSFQATLQLTTDQGAALGTAGQVFTYPLAGNSTVLLAGDFNLNGQLDAEDIDLLTIQVIAGTNDPAFDLDGDRLVDQTDHRVWVKDLKHSWYGDADLTGEFNSNDFVLVFQAGKYETAGNAGWSEGDWNGDGNFASADFITAFQDGGYEQGPRTGAVAVAVPEPAAWWLLAIGLLHCLLGRRPRRPA